MTLPAPINVYGRKTKTIWQKKTKNKKDNPQHGPLLGTLELVGSPLLQWMIDLSESVVLTLDTLICVVWTVLSYSNPWKLNCRSSLSTHVHHFFFFLLFLPPSPCGTVWSPPPVFCVRVFSLGISSATRIIIAFPSNNKTRDCEGGLKYSNWPEPTLLADTHLKEMSPELFCYNATWQESDCSVRVYIPLLPSVQIPYISIA